MAEENYDAGEVPTQDDHWEYLDRYHPEVLHRYHPEVLQRKAALDLATGRISSREALAASGAADNLDEYEKFFERYARSFRKVHQPPEISWDDVDLPDGVWPVDVSNDALMRNNPRYQL